MNQKQKGFAPIVIVLMVLVLAGVVGTSYYLINKNSNKVNYQELSGNYIRESEASPGEMKVSFIEKNKVKIEGSATWIGNASTGNVNTGNIECVVSIIDGKGQCEDTKYTAPKSCIINLSFEKDKITAKEQSLGPCGGLNVSFDGDYFRDKNKENLPQSLISNYSESIFKEINASMGDSAELTKKMFEVYSPDGETSAYILRMYDKQAGAITQVSSVLETKVDGKKQLVPFNDGSLSKYSYDAYSKKDYSSAGFYGEDMWLLPFPIVVPIKWINNEMLLAVKYDADEMIYSTIEIYNKKGEKYFSPEKINYLGLNYKSPSLTPQNINNWSIFDVCEYSKDKYVFITNFGHLDYIPSFIEYYPAEDKYIQMVPNGDPYPAMGCADLSEQNIKERLRLKTGIKILSPIAGDKLYTGYTYDIKWSANSSDNIKILEILSGNFYDDGIGYNPSFIGKGYPIVSLSEGSYRVTIPETPFFPLENKYRVYIATDNDEAYSEYFELANGAELTSNDVYKKFTFSSTATQKLTTIAEEDLTSIPSTAPVKYKIGDNNTVVVKFDPAEYFEVHNDNYSFTSEKERYTDFGVYQYKNDRYLLISKPSGGAFCCFVAYLFRLEQNGSFVLIGGLGDLDGNTNVNKKLMIDSSGVGMIEKNGKLYLKIADGRFHYFLNGGRPSSFNIYQYLLIDGDKLVLANSDFKEEFLKAATEVDNRLASCVENNNCNDSLNILSLGEMMANYVLAGKNQKANERIDFYFNSGKCSDCGERKEELKKEVTEKALLDCYSQQ